MKLIELFEGVGIIVPNVNTTVDVKPGETKRQAEKFGNTIGDDGQPPSYWYSAKLAAKKKKLKENELSGFMDSKIRNEYIKFNGLVVYLRKGPIGINGEIKNAIQLANVTNPRRSDNLTSDPKRKSTGRFSALMAALEKMAVEHGYDGVFVESILNDFLPSVLDRYGYSAVNETGFDVNYWKDVDVEKLKETKSIPKKLK